MDKLDTKQAGPNSDATLSTEGRTKLNKYSTEPNPVRGQYMDLDGLKLTELNRKTAEINLQSVLLFSHRIGLDEPAEPTELNHCQTSPAKTRGGEDCPAFGFKYGEDTQNIRGAEGLTAMEDQYIQQQVEPDARLQDKDGGDQGVHGHGDVQGHLEEEVEGEPILTASRVSCMVKQNVKVSTNEFVRKLDGQVNGDRKVQVMVGEWEKIILQKQEKTRPFVRAKRRGKPKDLQPRVQLGMAAFLDSKYLVQNGGGEGRDGVRDGVCDVVRDGVRDGGRDGERDGVRGGVHGEVRGEVCGGGAGDDGRRLGVRDGGTKRRRASGVVETPEKKLKR